MHKDIFKSKYENFSIDYCFAFSFFYRVRLNKSPQPSQTQLPQPTARNTQLPRQFLLIRMARR